jgi:hypothetical protein
MPLSRFGQGHLLAVIADVVKSESLPFPEGSKSFQQLDTNQGIPDS